MIFDAILSQFSFKKHNLFSVPLDFKILKFIPIKRRDYLSITERSHIQDIDVSKDVSSSRLLNEKYCHENTARHW